jgi:radical SAM superfamily enzyme YgiQ (UPF0313 family)
MLTAQEVFDLILYDVRKYGAKHFIIGDDDFPVGNSEGLKRLYELSHMIIDAKRKGELPEKLTFYMQARIADFIHRKDGKRQVNRELLQVLKQAGFYTYGLGVETFSDRLLKSPSVNKVGINAQDCIDVLDAMLDTGLNPLINVILCVPESTVEELIHTMRVAAQFIVKGCQTNVTAIMNAFPGAPLLSMPEYKYNTLTFEVPITGDKFEILRYFTPRDPKISAIYDNLREETAETRKELVKKTTASFDTLPKPIAGLTMFITVARLLGDKELENEFTAVTLEMIRRNGMMKDDFKNSGDLPRTTSGELAVSPTEALSPGA